MITVYGVPGWGSAISELMLTLAEIPYHFVNVEGFDKPGPRARARNAAATPVSAPADLVGCQRLSHLHLRGLP